MKPIILCVMLLLVFGLLAGCSQLTPTDIPLQNDSEEIVVGSSPSGAVVADESDIIDTPVEETQIVEDVVPEVEVPPVLELEPQSTYVILDGIGFGEVKEVRIKVGETVAWKNEREGRQQKAMVLGTQWCAFV